MPLLLLLCCWLVLAPARAQEGVDPAVQRALVQQELLPAMAARRLAAEARVSAGRAWFAGRGSWREAFPELEHAPLGDPGFLEASSWGLHKAAQARAAALSAPPPPGLAGADPELLSLWRDALEASSQAEELADDLQLRFLAGLAAALERAPGLRDAEVDPLLSEWAGLRADLGSEPEPEQLALAAAAGHAASELQALRQLAWRSATLPGDAALSEAVRAQLAPLPPAPPSDPVEALALGARVDRLERVAPLLPPEQGEAVAALALGLERLALSSERAHLEAALAQADGERVDELGVEQLEAQVKQLHESLERARQALTEEPQAAEQGGLQREVATLRVQLEEKRLATRQAALDRARRLTVTGLGHEADDTKLVAARREADLARQKAQDEADRTSQAEAALRERSADLRQEIAVLVEAEAARREASVAGLEALGTELEAQSDALLSALSLPPLDPQRQLRIDEAYLALRAVVAAMREALDERGDALVALRLARHERVALLEEQQPSLGDELSSEAIRELLAETGAARADLELALVERELAAADELDALLVLLVKAKVQRRRAFAEASASARQEIGRAFLPELVAELSEFPVRIAAQARHAGPWLRSLPARMLDLGAIWLLLAGSVELLLLGLLWIWLRRAAPTWLEQLVQRVQAASRDRDARGLPRWLSDQAQRWLEPGDPGKASPALASLARVVVDVLASWQLARMLAGAPPVVSLLAWGFAAVVLWRALPAMLTAVVATPDEDRPALRLLRPSTRALALWTARLAVGWWLILVLSRQTSLRLLQADRLHDLVGVLGSLAFWSLLLLALHRWSPVLVSTLGERPDSRLVRWASSGSASWLLRTLQGGTALGLLLAQLAGRLGARLSSSGPRMSRLAALLARRQLRDATERSGEPIDAELARRLAVLRPPLPGVESLQHAFERAFEAWLPRRRRGLHVVTGDRGQGKSTLLNRLGRSLGAGHKVIALQLERVDGPEGARVWLADRVLGRREPCSRVELIDEISLLPGPRVFLVDELERLFLREVGGFAALREVLQVMHATSDEHFWVVSFHGPTWAYLRGVPSVFDPAFFERVEAIEPVGPDALARWLGIAAQQAELELDFDELAGVGPNTLEADRLRGRARAAFWRLLADASGGNPEVARELWLEGLSVREGILRVGLFDAPASTRLQDLTDNELFVLTAVVVHDQLDVEQLARVLNLPRSGVRTACQRLVARGVLASDGFENSSLYRLQLTWLPAVERHLRNKNFLAAG
jgi:hypothetical protein